MSNRILKVNDVVDVFKNIAAVETLLPGGITSEMIIREKSNTGTSVETPYMGIEMYKFQTFTEFFTQGCIVSCIIAGGNKTTVPKIQNVIEAIDNAILRTIDGVLPIQSWGNVLVIDIASGATIQQYRDIKGNISVRKDYIFTYQAQGYDG